MVNRVDMRKIVLILGLFWLLVGASLISLTYFSTPRNVNFSISNPKSDILLMENFTILPSSTVRHSISLNEGDNISMLVRISEADSFDDDVIDFSVNDGSQKVISYSGISHLPWPDYVWAVPRTANYALVYDNTLSTIGKDAIVQLTKVWREPQNLTITMNLPILPPSYTYVGIAVVLAGSAFVVIGLIERKNHVSAEPKSKNENENN